MVSVISQSLGYSIMRSFVRFCFHVLVVSRTERDTFLIDLRMFEIKISHFEKLQALLMKVMIRYSLILNDKMTFELDSIFRVSQTCTYIHLPQACFTRTYA